MSATLSSHTIETLDALFGPRDTIQLVSSVHLRPEPRYFSYRAINRQDKQRRVLELLRHAPRPFILYVTEREHAVSWLRILKKEGYVRVRCFHGDTPTAEREDTIKNWGRNRLDGIVATSAFGVGMDKQDVRTVIHAAIPESLDRYYQEVGRGGRDGCASLSVVIYTDRDEGIARGMKPKVIGDDKAYERWISMLGSSNSIGADDLYRVDLTVPPKSLQQQSDYNNDWNMRTLILMARAGLIELESVVPETSTREPKETEEAFSARVDDEWRKYFSSIPVRTVDPRHRQRQHFEATLNRERDCGERSAEQSMNNLMFALRGEREMSMVLSDMLTVHDPDRVVTVSRACRGCPAEIDKRRIGVISYQDPPGIGIAHISKPNIDLWSSRFPWLDMSPIVVLYPDQMSAIEGPVAKALTALVSMFGVREISTIKDQWVRNSILRNLHNDCQSRVLIARALEEDKTLGDELPLPRATLLFPWRDRPIPDYLLIMDRPLHVIFAPENTPDGDHPLRLYRDSYTNQIRLDSFLEGAMQ